MRFVKSEITALVSSNVLENETEWLVSDTYNRGDERRDGHYIYAYLGVDGTNSALKPSLSPIEWLVQRPTNYWAMIDGSTSTQTTRADNITVEIATNNFDTISLLDIEAKTVILTLTVSATVVYTKTYDLQDESEVIDFYSYCFSDFIYKSSLYNQDLPLYLNGTLKVEIINTGATAKCGSIISGRSFYVGKTLYGASLGLESYSTKQVDEFGTETLVKRGAVNLDSYDIRVPTNKVPTLKRKAIEYDAVPLLFVFDESTSSTTENLLVHGYYQNMSVMLSNPSESVISLTVKGIL
jgi:hypothetical protein